MPALDDYNSLYYDLKCINVFRESKLTNTQYKELVSKIDVRPYNKDEIITELHEETKAALYLVITGSVWLGRDGMAPIKLPSGCNFGEELLKASEGNDSAIVISPYSVTAADDACVCAVLTMDACREVFDIDNAKKQNDANLNMLLNPYPSITSSPVMSSKKLTKHQKSPKKRDDDVPRSSKSSKSAKVKKEKKKSKDKVKEKKIEATVELHDDKFDYQNEMEVNDEVTERRGDDDEVTEVIDEVDTPLLAVSSTHSTEGELVPAAANDATSPELKSEKGGLHASNTSITLDGFDPSEVSLQENEKSKNSLDSSTTSFSELRNKFSGSRPVGRAQGNFSLVNSVCDATQKATPSVSFTGTTRRWGKDAAPSVQPAAQARQPAFPAIIETTDAEGDASYATEIKAQRSTVVEPGHYRGPVSAKRGTVAERFLSKVVNNAVKQELPKPPMTHDDIRRDVAALELEDVQAQKVTPVGDEEAEPEVLQAERFETADFDGEPAEEEQPPPPSPPPTPKEIASPVRMVRNAFENQMKREQSLTPPRNKDLISPVRIARNTYENQIKQNGPAAIRPLDNSNHSDSASSEPTSPTKERHRFSLPVQCNRGLFVESGQEGSESFSNEDGPIREVFNADKHPEVIPEADEELYDENGESSMNHDATEEIKGLSNTAPIPVPPLAEFESPKSSPKKSKSSKKEKDKKEKKEKKKRAETKIVEPDLSPVQPKKMTGPLLSPRKRKDKASFIARIARFEDQGGKDGVPVIRQAGNVYQVPTKLPTNFRAPQHPKTDQEERLLKNAIKKRFVFENLPDKTIKSLTAAFEKVNVPAGTQLFAQGDEDKYFYVVSVGQCDIIIDGERHDVATNGDSFGEEALLHNSRRLASATATTDSVLYRFDQTTFRHLLQDEATRSTVHKRALLEKLDFLENASTEQLHKLSNLLTLIKFKKGEILAKQDNIGDKFFLIAEGSVECRDVKVGRLSKDNKIMGPGDYFGKHAVLAEEPIMKANVVALTHGKAYVVSRELKDQAMGSSLVPIHSRTLHSVRSFERKPGRPLKHHEIVGLTRLIKNVEYSKGDTIIEVDQDVDAAIYFVRSGKVYETEGRNLLLISEGAHFGENLFQSARDNKALKGRTLSKVTAESDCTCGVLSVKDYYAFFGDQIVGANDTNFLESPQSSPKSSKTLIDVAAEGSKSSKTRALKDEKKAKKAKASSDVLDNDNLQLYSPKATLNVNIKLENLERRVCLGEGEFGQVWLVVDKEAKKQQPFVLKIQSKYHLITEGEVEVCKREKDVLLNVNHPFIIDLFQTYQDAAFVYMLLDFVPGGELFSILNNDDGRIKIHEDRARFYLLGIADALAHLHQKKYVYRDLKPENVMLDRFGFPKLIDFGFTKKVMDQTFTLCGTPAYLAPEIVISQGHSWPVDHWALGVLSFEMVMGFSPFYEDGIEQFELYRLIVEEDFPELEGRSSEAVDFISRLLEKSPSNRLGSLARGEKDILSHRWFGDLSTVRMRERAIQAPWIPTIQSLFDTSNFDDWSGVTDKTLDKGPPLSDKHMALFEGF
jgi:CRP-like cAMP-binding protein